MASRVEIIKAMIGNPITTSQPRYFVFFFKRICVYVLIWDQSVVVSNLSNSMARFGF